MVAAPNILLKERPRRICNQAWMLGFALCDIVRALLGRLTAAGARTMEALIARMNRQVAANQMDDY